AARLRASKGQTRTKAKSEIAFGVSSMDAELMVACSRTRPHGAASTRKSRARRAPRRTRRNRSARRGPARALANVVALIVVASVVGAALGCRSEPSETRMNVSARGAEGASSVTSGSAPSASATASGQQPLTLERLQGRWRVQTSSGDLEHGYAFRPL